MKTTIELDDPLLRRAKAHAAARGITLEQFFAEAIERRLQAVPTRGTPPAWTALLGELSALHGETARIDERIDAEFGQIEAEDRE